MATNAMKKWRIFGMKQLCKRSLALLMVLVMLVGLLPAITIQTNAATYTYNWGTRGTVADEDDFTRSTAEEWYAARGTSYEELSQLLGSATSSSVPTSEMYRELRSLMTSAHSNKTSYDGTKTLFQYTDCQNGGGAISSFYSGNSIGPSWNGSWNREHTWPNSKGDANGSGENDIFMLRPTSTSENSSRGNDAYGEGGNYYHPNAESGGKYDLRGDVVRIIMFVYVRWQNISSGAGVLYGENGVIENRDVMLKWMKEDPVDTWELGRNDACQSITGTRNVFVDYPELGFLLFGADVPDNYTSPSGQGNSVSYKITATSNNTSYGTVSLSGKTITATPKSGYYASGYTVTSGNATVTQDGNTFTVNAQSDCTVRINFAARQQVTVSFAGADVASKTGYAGDAMSLPTVTAPEGYTFLGWMTSKLSTDTTTKPINYYTASFTPTASTTLYALYTYSVGGSGATEYVLTDLADIGANETTIITVTTSSGTVYAMNNDNGTSKAPAGVIVTVSADGTVLTTEPADNLKWNVGGSADAYIFYPEGSTSTWLYCTSTNNGVRVGTTAANTFKIDSSTKYLYHNGTGRYLGVYTTNPDWRCYTTNGSNIANQTWKFFVLREQGITYYTGDPIKCEHTDTTNTPAVAATCTEGGFTAGVQCNDCGSFISGHEEIAALGHKYGNWVTTTQPTCTATGVQTKTCSACGDKQTQSVAALGHSYNAVVTAPTTYEQGYTTYTCSACGHSYVSDYVEALGETYIVKFCVPSDVEAVPDMQCGKTGITLPDAGVPSGEHTYTFAGWSTSPVEDTDEEPEFYQAGETFTATGATKLYAVYTYVMEGEGGNGDYVKVTEAPSDWSGEYVIVYETNSLIFDGSLSKLDAVKNTQEVTITNNVIAAAEGDPYKFTIAAVEGGYSVQATNGNYIGRTATSNGLNEGTTPYAHTITIDSSGNVKLISASGPYLNFNAATDQMRFRYYKSGQKPIQLYVKSGSSGAIWYTSVDGGVCSHGAEMAVNVAPTLTQQGYTQYVCADCGENLYIEDYADAIEKENWNMTLQDDLTVNFQIEVHKALWNTLQIKITFNGKTEIYSAADGICKASVNVAAAQMADEITVEYVNGEESVTKTYSVKAYADYILNHNYDEETKALVQAMLNYGGAAQTYFGYNTENLVSDQLGANEVPETAQNEMTVSGSADGIVFYGASLVYREKIAVRFYFTGAAEGVSFTVAGKERTPVEKEDGLYYIEIGDILPQNLDQQITVQVGDSLTVAYSPMNYMVRMNQKGDVNMQNLMKALYNYHLMAKAFVQV